MAERHSALAGHVHPGRSGGRGDPGVRLGEIANLVLHQVAAWPDTLGVAGDKAAQAVAAVAAPAPGRAASGERGALLRIEPLKWWVFGAPAPALGAGEGATLDLSHSRTHVRISGPDAATLLNRHLPLDLREAAFPVDTVAASALHHVGVTLWRSGAGYELFLPRGFALSLWELLVQSAAQFGAEVLAPSMDGNS